MDSLFARRAEQAKRSVLRELLKVSEQPGIISLAGGLPDPETFPRKILAEIAADEILHNYKKSLQYTTTEGKRPLRAALIDWFAKDGLHYEMDQVIITAASQQGLDLVAKTFLDPGDAVFLSLPTYLGAIQAFRAFEARLVGVPLLEDGMDIDALRQAISRERAAGHRPKLIYVVPDFQNPTGITWSQEKREELLEVAGEENLVVIEDMPYRKLRYSGEPQPPLAALDDERRVLVLFTFSKVLAAGLRLGAMAGPEKLIEKIITMKQATDLCTSSLAQRLAARFMLEHDICAHLEKLCAHYRVKRDAMLEALDRYMPKVEGLSWTKPEGGLFLWVKLPQGADTERMFIHALEHKVAYVIGSTFFVDGGGRNTMRLNFSKPSLEEIDEGVKRLATVVKAELANLPVRPAA